jgi:hypothetical protein
MVPSPPSLKGAEDECAKILLTSLVCAGLHGPAFAASFEGVVTLKGASDGDVTTRKTYFKADKMRVDERDRDYMVWDATKKEGYRVDAKTRTVMVMPWRDVKPGDAKKMFEGMTVTKTGKERLAAPSGYKVIDRAIMVKQLGEEMRKKSPK